MASLQVTPSAKLKEGIELNFRGLYLHHTSQGSNANQVVVVNRNDYGTLVANNWEVCDGFGQNARVVARAQGLHIHAGHWHMSFTLVFEDERFKGSTLEVMGIDDEADWAIVGGTGQFAMATGVIRKNWHLREHGPYIVEIAIEAFCPKIVKASWGIQLPTKIGTWGGDKGSAKDVVEPPKRLESITIRSGAVIDAIEFSYVDQAGQKRTAGPWGGAGGPDVNKMELGPSEFVKEVSGMVGVYKGETVVSAIKLVTNVKTFGPFGKGKDGTMFSVPMQGGSGIAAFFGRSGKYLNAIGVYVAPLD